VSKDILIVIRMDLGLSEMKSAEVEMNTRVVGLIKEKESLKFPPA
jgi:hypothetical protein